jgi:dihydroorotase
VDKNTILSKCGWSPLEGTTFQTKVTYTFVNGNLIYENGKFDETKRGQALQIST